MTALAAALMLALAPQDEAKLKESWPKLVDAWKAVEVYKAAPDSGPLDDECLKVVAKLHGAFESAGLMGSGGEYLAEATKAFIKARARALAPAGPSDFHRRFGLIRRIRVAGAGPGVVEPAHSVDADPMGSLLASLKKLQTLKQGGLDDEDNVQDELATARKSLKALGITADDTPPALRRRILHLIRALALGEDYPAPAAATEEQTKQIRAWISDLGHESIETRESATRELLRAGEASLPLVREALKSADAEVAARARRLLGVGHAPWKAIAARPEDALGDVFDVLVAPPLVAPPPPPKEDKPK